MKYYFVFIIFYSITTEIGVFVVVLFSMALHMYKRHWHNTLKKNLLHLHESQARLLARAIHGTVGIGGRTLVSYGGIQGTSYAHRGQ